MKWARYDLSIDRSALSIIFLEDLVVSSSSFQISHCTLQFWRDVAAGQGNEQFHICFLFFVSSIFSIALCSLLGFHIYLVLNNRTTLEASRFKGQHFFALRRNWMEIHEIFRAPVFRRGPDKDGFSLGKRRNLAEVKIAMLFVLH